VDRAEDQPVQPGGAVSATQSQEHNVNIDDLLLLSRYNYDEFIPEKFDRWLRFEASPPLGQPAPDFLLWRLDGSETRLSAIWSSHTYTVVEFSSFT
jgi:hypothetical protein